MGYYSGILITERESLFFPLYDMVRNSYCCWRCTFPTKIYFVGCIKKVWLLLLECWLIFGNVLFSQVIWPAQMVHAALFEQSLVLFLLLDISLMFALCLLICSRRILFLPPCHPFVPLGVIPRCKAPNQSLEDWELLQRYPCWLLCWNRLPSSVISCWFVPETMEPQCL